MLEYILFPLFSPINNIGTWRLVEFFLALSNLAHFLSFWWQITTLIGKDGLAPAVEFLERSKRANEQEGGNRWQLYFRCPTLFWLWPTDKGLHLLCGTGVAVSLILLANPEMYLLWWPMMFLALSLCTIIRPFTLQMEPMMVEINFLMGLVTPLRSHSALPILAFRWFILRLMLSAGLVKWYGSKKWRNLSAMSVHYYTQPLPNALSYYFHHMPDWFHRSSVWATLLIEGPLCLLCFSPWSGPRYFIFLAYTGLMLGINLSGNYGYLGLTTIAASISLLDDWIWPMSAYHQLLDRPSQLLLSSYFFPSNGPSSPIEEVSWEQPILADCSGLGGCAMWWLVMAVAACFTLLYFVVSLVPLRYCWKDRARSQYLQPPRSLERIYVYANQLYLVNRYGMFGSMHDFRWEFMLEGSLDGYNWKRYGLPFKPWHPSRAPGLVPPLYWPRLDWHLWFLPLRYERELQTIFALCNRRNSLTKRDESSTSTSTSASSSTSPPKKLGIKSAPSSSSSSSQSGFSVHPSTAGVGVSEEEAGVGMAQRLSLHPNLKPTKTDKVMDQLRRARQNRTQLKIMDMGGLSTAYPVQVPNWYNRLIEGLLQGNPKVLRLMGHNPFPDGPPRYVRTAVYDYTFVPWKLHRALSEVTPDGGDDVILASDEISPPPSPNSPAKNGSSSSSSSSVNASNSSSSSNSNSTTASTLMSVLENSNDRLPIRVGKWWIERGPLFLYGKIHELPPVLLSSSSSSSAAPTR